MAALEREQRAAHSQAAQLWATRRERNDTTSLQDYRARMRDKHAERQALIDLPKAQHACETLDRAAGVTESALWYRPPPPPPREDIPGVPIAAAPAMAVAAAAHETTAGSSAADVFATLEPGEQLGIVVSYLRNAHLYCFWCARQHDTLDQLEDECAECSSDNRE